MWQKRILDILISRTFVAAKEKQFFEMLCLEGTFDASSGWLTGFQQWHGIQEIGHYGGKLSCDRQAVEYFKTDFEPFLQSEGVSYK